MNILDAKRAVFDKMKKYATDEAAARSEPLKPYREAKEGVPIAHESVTIVAKPKPGAKLSPDELKQKVGKMGLLPEADDLLEQMGGPTSVEDIEDALEPVDSPKEEAMERIKTVRR